MDAKTSLLQGPWEAVDSMTVRGPFYMGDPQRPGLLVAILPNYRPAEERAQMARLIAAAPDLLEQLQRVYDSLSGETFDWEPVRAAIAKATGAQA